MRKGQNPARIGLPAYTPKRLGVASLVYIPHQEGYFAQSLQILKIQLASLRAHTGEEFDLLVMDNGSSAEIQKGLQSLQVEGLIDWLILSRHNLGKTGALNWILGAMPNEVIGYCDSDVYFRQGWFGSSFKILEAFPRAAIVTAQPNFFDVFRGKSTAHLGLPAEDYEKTDFHPRAEVVDEYCHGIGASGDLSARYHQQVLAMYTSKKNGVQAVLGANHMQFIGWREVLQQVLPLPATRGLSPEEDHAFDLGLNQKGYVHLATPEAYVVHIGNELDETILAEINQLKTEVEKVSAPVETVKARPASYRVLAALAGSRIFGRLIKRLYNGLFQIYSEGRN
jgi:hypothetical protein